MNTEKRIPERKPLSPEEMEKRMKRIAELEKTDCPPLDGTAPIDAVSVYDCFVNNYEQAKAAFIEKRVDLTGVIIKIGPDIHGKPSIELSDKADGRCYALFVFPNDDFYGKVKEGDTVVCRGNLLSAREPYGAVLKKCELVEVKHPN